MTQNSSIRSPACVGLQSVKAQSSSFRKESRLRHLKSNLFLDVAMTDGHREAKVESNKTGLDLLITIKHLERRMEEEYLMAAST